MADKRMKGVAMSHSVERVQAFLQAHPDKLNHEFPPRGEERWTLLGFASNHGDAEIVRYLVSMPNIDLSLGLQRSVSPLDLALLNRHPQVVRALMAHGAPLKVREQEELIEFVNQDLATNIDQMEQEPQQAEQEEPYRGAEWVPPEVHEHMRQGTLVNMSASDIKQALLKGTLPCGWLPKGAWPDIQRQAQDHESARLQNQQRVEQLKQTWHALVQRRQELEGELQEIKTQTKELDSRIQEEEENLASTPDYSSLVSFAALVTPIEQALVGQLETELAQRKPQLASLDDDESPKPKLSLLLNCMGIDASGIAATSSLDLTQFTRHTGKTRYFKKGYGSCISRNVVWDLLYCGELARKGSCVGHDDECVVCANKTPEQLINLLREREITLDGMELRRQGINGPRVLFCTPKEFPQQPAEQVNEAIDALLALHEKHL